jgi:hypothetical protein
MLAVEVHGCQGMHSLGHGHGHGHGPGPGAAVT